MSNDLRQRAAQIRLLLSDCDGVLTDAGVYYGEQGEVLKKFNMRDGMAVERLRNTVGIDFGIITGELSPSVKKRAEKLKISELHLGIKDKVAVLAEICQRRGLSPAQIAFIGDDVNDLGILGLVGLAACPADALPQVKQVAQWTSTLPGGGGCVRELAEWIITVQDA
jgi:YrbI family 3-deoxy-D-manno-octulosonate 8-phosphate phosphatase